MGGTRIPGPINESTGRELSTYSYTNQRCMIPGATGRSASVANMSLDDRFEMVVKKTLPLLPSEVAEEFTALLDPYVLGLIVGTLVVWAGSHYFGVGFIVDGLLVVAGFAFFGLQVVYSAGDLMDAVSYTYSAQTEDDLDQAAKKLANFIAVVGVAAFMALVAKKGVPKGSSRLRYLEKARTWMARAADAGMPTNHFNVFKRVAGEADKVILVRQTNPKSVQWIERGFPPKPKVLESAAGEGLKTSKTTGLTTAKPSQVDAVRNKVHKGSGKKYYVVDKGGATATNGSGDVIHLDRPDWPVQPGQVIDPVVKKPIPGDYDLMGVVDQSASGRNLALVTSHGERLENFTNTQVKDVANRVNAHLDQPRVLHGPEEAYGNWNRIKADEVVIAFFPDGTTTAYNRRALIELYEQMGRQMLNMKGAFGD